LGSIGLAAEARRRCPSENVAVDVPVREAQEAASERVHREAVPRLVQEWHRRETTGQFSD
jgi:hypothetical protein